MSEFKVIETQEELDRIIGERVSRAKEATRKEYEGFVSPADLKSKTDDLTNRINELNTEISGYKDRAAQYDAAIADKDNKLKAYETASVKTKIARELGLPFEAVDFMQGTEEDDIRKSGSMLKALISPSGQMPPASTEPAEDDAKYQAYKELLGSLRKD